MPDGPIADERGEIGVRVLADRIPVEPRACLWAIPSGCVVGTERERTGQGQESAPTCSRRGGFGSLHDFRSTNPRQARGPMRQTARRDRRSGFDRLILRRFGAVATATAAAIACSSPSHGDEHSASSAWKSNRRRVNRVERGAVGTAMIRRDAPSSKLWYIHWLRKSREKDSAKSLRRPCRLCQRRSHRPSLRGAARSFLPTLPMRRPPFPPHSPRLRP